MHVHTHTQSVSVSQICADYISCCVLGEWAACRVRWPSSAPSKPGPGQQRLPLFVRDQTEKHRPHDNKKYTPLLCSILYILPNQHFAFFKTLSKQKQKKNLGDVWMSPNFSIKKSAWIIRHFGQYTIKKLFSCALSVLFCSSIAHWKMRLHSTNDAVWMHWKEPVMAGCRCED